MFLMRGAMRDVELYRAILGLTPPWTVVSVELDVTGQRAVVQVDAGGGPVPRVRHRRAAL
jgi:hypothetical protein